MIARSLPPRRAGVPVVLGLIAAAVSSHCNPFAGPDEEVEVVVGAAHFRFGEPIRFEVRNQTAVDIIFNTCDDGSVAIGLLRRVEGRWGNAGGRGCAVTDFATLEAGGRISSRRSGVFDEGLYALALAYTRPPTSDEWCCIDGDGVRTLSNSSAFHISP